MVHEYNYLRDAVFKLCEALSNIKNCAAKDIFEEFDIKDLEEGKWLGKSR